MTTKVLSSVVSWLREGKSYNWIADKFNVSMSAVRKINYGEIHAASTGATADEPISPRTRGRRTDLVPA